MTARPREPEGSAPGFIARVIAASARRPFLTLLAVAVLACWGWASLRHAPLDAQDMLRVHLDLIFGERRTT